MKLKYELKMQHLLDLSYTELLTIDVMEFNFRTHTKIKSEIVIEHYDSINKGRQENHKSRK